MSVCRLLGEADGVGSTSHKSCKSHRVKDRSQCHVRLHLFICFQAFIFTEQDQSFLAILRKHLALSGHPPQGSHVDGRGLCILLLWGLGMLFLKYELQTWYKGLSKLLNLYFAVPLHSVLERMYV